MDVVQLRLGILLQGRTLELDEADRCRSSRLRLNDNCLEIDHISALASRSLKSFVWRPFFGQHPSKVVVMDNPA